MISDASDSVRKCQNRNIHRSFDEKCQRLMNAMGVKSYICPHRHLLDTKNECLISVRGLFAAVFFWDNGNVEQIEFFATEKFKNISVGLELPLEAWHAVVALKHGSILFEVKEGPFYPSRGSPYSNRSSAPHSK
jgi:cupin fold WbuC family metalloprotein